jgi:hypothetical protein
MHSNLAEAEGLNGFTRISLNSFNLQLETPDLLTGFAELSRKAGVFVSERRRLSIKHQGIQKLFA